MAFQVVHRSIKRNDGERKVTGAARYTGDLQLPGLLHARLVLSAHPHARVTALNREAAAALPGVVGVFTAADLDLKGADNGSRNRRPLAGEEAVFEGQPIAVVVAESLAAAQDAADLVEVDYELLPAVADPEAAIAAGSPPVRASGGPQVREEGSAHATVSGEEEEEEEVLPPNAAAAKRFRRGDVEAALASSDAVVERTYRTSWVHQLHLEPQSSVAAPDGQGGLHVWTSTQGIFTVRAETAAAVGLPQYRVQVTAMDVGGGFGAKYALIDPLVGALAWKLGRPVSLIYTRGEEFRSANPAPGSVIHLTAGARRDGTLTALRARIVMESGAYPGETMTICALLLGGTYTWPNLDLQGYEVLTNKAGAGAYRAPGAPQAAFAVEGAIDELARRLDLDPLRFRLQNAVRQGDLMPPGNAYPTIGAVECLEALAAHPLLQQRERVPGEGIGIALAGWPGGLQPASAACRLNEDGTLSVLTGVTDISGSFTSLGLIAAEAFGLPVQQVDVRALDTDSAPFAGPSGGSKTIYTAGAAVIQAAQDARRQVLDIAAQELEVAPEDLEIADGAVGVRGVPGRSISLQAIAEASVNWAGSYQPVLGRGGSAITSSAPGFTAHAARVRVDEETGQVELLDYVAVQDVGCAINPAEVEGQIHGGVVQGIGWALYEAIPYGEDARLLGSSLMDYAVPTADKVPPIDTVLVEVPSPDGPFGAKGVGEPPIIPGAAAIANAILDATGARPTSIPMTPPRVLRALLERAQ